MLGKLEFKVSCLLLLRIFIETLKMLAVRSPDAFLFLIQKGKNHFPFVELAAYIITVSMSECIFIEITD